jgi:hypothetical protein
MAALFLGAIPDAWGQLIYPGRERFEKYNVITLVEKYKVIIPTKSSLSSGVIVNKLE